MHARPAAKPLTACCHDEQGPCCHDEQGLQERCSCGSCLAFASSSPRPAAETRHPNLKTRNRQSDRPCLPCPWDPPAHLLPRASCRGLLRVAARTPRETLSAVHETRHRAAEGTIAPQALCLPVQAPLRARAHACSAHTRRWRRAQSSRPAAVRVPSTRRLSARLISSISSCESVKTVRGEGVCRDGVCAAA